MKRNTTKMMCLCGIFAALTAICSQIAFNIGPVPINLATLSVFFAGGLLGAKYGAISQLVYVLIGAFGAPVFANFTGGFSIIIGATGGYIVGYIAAAFITGLIAKKFIKHRLIGPIFGMIVGLIVCYVLGTAWFMFVTKNGLWQSLVYCVFPFIAFDLIKIALAVSLVTSLKKALKI